MELSRAVYRCIALLSMAFVLGFVGCGPSRTTVSGEVTLDGQPLDNGSITFIPLEGDTPSAGIAITAGEYHVELAPGKKRVEISATKVVGKRQVYEGDPNSPVVEDVREIIPPVYNAQSTLAVDITPGNNTHSFDLQSSK